MMGYLLEALAQRAHLDAETFDALGAQVPAKALEFQRAIGMTEDEDDGDG
jgi:hypothetical protein